MYSQLCFLLLFYSLLLLYAPFCFRAKPKILYQHRIGRKFQQVLKEILSLFPAVDLKVEFQFIIEKNMARRDVFGQLPMVYGKSLTQEFNLPIVNVACIEFLKCKSL